MKSLISVKLAGNTFLLISGMLALFHILVLTKILPSDIVWGGQFADSETNMLVIEIVSLIATLIFMFVVALKIGYFKSIRFGRRGGLSVWLIFAYLIMNTAGNLTSGWSTENLIFAPISLLLAFCALRIAVEK